MSDQVHRFYEIEQQKLLLDFEKISLFTRHPTSLGSYRESRLRQYLRDFTPRQLTLGTGFISVCTTNGLVSDSQSRQIDCLVFDETRRHPELRTDDYVIVRPEAVYAAIEIKSDLTFYKQKGQSSIPCDDFPFVGDGQSYRWAGTLVDALQNIKSVETNRIVSATKGYFSGIFGYSASFSLSTLFWALDCGQLQKQLHIDHVDALPHAICVPGKFLIHFSPYDFVETSAHHDPNISFMNTITATKSSAAYPLQFFTNFYLAQITYSLTSEISGNSGLSSSGSDVIGICRQNFELCSSGHEDQ